MIKNNLIKIIIVISILLLIFSNYTVYADPLDLDEYLEGLNDPTENPDSWKPKELGDEPELTEKAGNLLQIVNTIGIILSVIILVILGMKYMLGSVEEKAEYKKSMIPYIIGVFLLASATTLPNMIYKIVNSLESSL